MGRKLAGQARARTTAGQSVKGMPDYAPRQRGKILVVDDDQCMREGMSLFLGESGYACTTCENAFAAIGHLERDRFDLIITDLHMPICGGMDLLERIKTRWPTTKVMIITGDSDVGMRNHAIKNGADKYLTKPFSLERLLCDVDSCLVSHRPGKEIVTNDMTSKVARC